MTATLGIATLETGVDLKGLDRGLQQGEQKTNSFFQEVKTGFARSVGGAALGAAGIAGRAIVDFAKQASAEFQTFENSIAEVFTLMPDMTAEAMSQMETDVMSFSVAVGRQTDETIPALYQAISSGVPQENVFGFLKIASDAAEGGVTDLETAVDGITSVVNAYGAETTSAAEASDVMFTAVRLGKTNFEQLSASLFQVIPTASSLGVSFEDVAANLAALTLQGVPTSVATTQLRAAFVEASKGGTELSNAIQNLTGKSFTDLIKDGQTSSEIFDALRSSMPEQEFKDLFGSVEALNAVLGITGPNAQNTANAFEEMKDSAGATSAAAETMNQSYQALAEDTAAAKEQVMILIGEGLIPGQKAALTFARDTLVLAGGLLQLNKAAEDASDGIVELVESGVDAEQNADKLLGMWVELDDFWGRTIGRQKLVDDIEGVIVATTSMSGSLEDVEARLHELDPAFDVTAQGIVTLDGDMVSTVDTLRELSTEAKIAADTHTLLSKEVNTVATTALPFYAEQAIAANAASLELTASNDLMIAGYQATVDILPIYAERAMAAEDATYAAALAADEERDSLIELTSAIGGYFDASLTATGQADSFEVQLYEAGAAAGLGATELAILATATGDYTAAEIKAAFETAVMQSNIDALVVAMQAGTITAEEATTALDLLESGEADTAAEAITLAGNLGQVHGPLINIRDTAIGAADAIKSIPKEVNVNYTSTGSTQEGGGGKSSSSRGSYASGGWTGYGAEDEYAGVVHKNELVVPSSALQAGPAGILDFAERNVPGGLGNSMGGMGGGDTAYNLNVTYTNNQSEGSLLSDLRLFNLMTNG